MTTPKGTKMSQIKHPIKRPKRAALTSTERGYRYHYETRLEKSTRQLLNLITEPPRDHDGVSGTRALEYELKRLLAKIEAHDPIRTR